MIEGISVTTATIGLIAASIVILTFTLYPALREFKHRLILYLAISDAFGALSMLFFPEKDSVGCYIQSVSITYFDFQSVAWVVVIAWLLYQVVVNNQANVQNYEKRLFYGIIAISAVLSALPFTTSSYGKSAQGYCWVNEQTGREVALVWQLVVFYLPLWAGFLSTIYFYMKVYQVSRKFYKGHEEKYALQLQYIARLRFFAFTLVVGWFFGTINRVHLFFHKDNPNLTLIILHLAFSNLVGLYNFLVYWMHRPVLNEVCRSFQKCIGKKEEVEQVELSDEHFNQM